MPVPLLRDAKPRQAGSTVSVYARVQCQRAQNMTEKGSILKQRRNTLLIWVYNLSMHSSNDQDAVDCELRYDPTNKLLEKPVWKTAGSALFLGTTYMYKS